MKPDFADLLPDLRAAGHRSVLVAPIQFLADHLEVLYDIDIGARAQADEAGMAFARIESLNVMPDFVAALCAVASGVVQAWPPAQSKSHATNGALPSPSRQHAANASPDGSSQARPSAHRIATGGRLPEK